MAEIDFEKIRCDVLTEVTKDYVDDPYGRMLKVFADLSSQISKKMLEEYDRKLHQGD